MKTIKTPTPSIEIEQTLKYGVMEMALISIAGAHVGHIYRYKNANSEYWNPWQLYTAKYVEGDTLEFMTKTSKSLERKHTECEIYVRKYLAECLEKHTG